MVRLIKSLVQKRNARIDEMLRTEQLVNTQRDDDYCYPPPSLYEVKQIAAELSGGNIPEYLVVNVPSRSIQHKSN